MSKWGLAYKGTEILTPEEWNAVVDALEELDKRAPTAVRGGKATIPSGSTRVAVTHGVGGEPTAISYIGTHPEVKSVWVENVTTTSFDLVVETAVTADRDVYWIAIRL